MKRPAAGSVLAGLLVAGCAHYQPAPVELAGYPAAYDARRLDPPAAGAAWKSADLLSAAIARNPAIVEAGARYRTAVAAARTARVPAPPSLTLTAEYANDATASSPWLFGGLADLPLDIGGRRGSRLATADLVALQALYDYGEAVWAVRTALARAEVEFVFAEQEIALARQAVTTRGARVEALSRRVAAGEDARPLSLLAQAELAASARRLSDAQARLEQARVALAKGAGVSAAQLPAIALEPSPRELDEAALPIWRSEAATARRDILRSVADYDAAEQALRLEVAKQYPEVRLQPGYTWERGLTKLPFSLALALPPRDLNRAAIAQAEAKRTEAARTLESLQAGALSAVDQAVAARTAARGQSERTRLADLAAANRTAELTRLQQARGELDRTDTLAAEAARLDMELVLLDLRRTAALGTVDLEDALRRSFDPAETALLQDAMKTLGAAG